MIYGLYKKRSLIDVSKDPIKLYMLVWANHRIIGPITPENIEVAMRAGGYRLVPMAAVRLPTRKVKAPTAAQALGV